MRRLISLATVLLLLCVGVAQAEVEHPVTDVTVEWLAESSHLYVDWDVEGFNPNDLTSAPDNISIWVLVDGLPYLTYTMDGWMRSRWSYFHVYFNPWEVEGRNVSVLLRAEEGSEVQSWVIATWPNGALIMNLKEMRKSQKKENPGKSKGHDK
jgi:hypothetical protein